MACHPAGSIAKRNLRLLLGARPVEHVALRVPHLRQAIFRHEQLFVQRSSLFVLEVGLIRTEQQLFVTVRLKTPCDPRRAQQKAHPRLDLWLVHGIPDQFVDAVLPAPAIAAEIVKAVARQLGSTWQALRPLIRFACRLIIAEVTADVAQLDQESRKLLVRRAIQAPPDHGLHHLELAEVPIDGARLAKRREVLGRELPRGLEVP